MINIYYIIDKSDPKVKDFNYLAEKIGGEVIDFYTMDLNKLTIIAKHRILPVPTILILNNNKTLARLVRPGNPDAILDLLVDILPEKY